MKKYTLLILILFSGCARYPKDDAAYQAAYQYVEEIDHLAAVSGDIEADSEAYIIVHVDAPRLDYRDCESCLKSMHKRSGAFRTPQVGHAWVALSYRQLNGERVVHEVGHSGEQGLLAPKYFDEVVRRAKEEDDPNPIRYLHTRLPDGYLEIGSGGHAPTSSLLIPISQQGVEAWKRLVFGPDGYDFHTWSLQDHNCISFVIASLASCGIDIDLDMQEIHIPQFVHYNRLKLRLWTNPRYGRLSIYTVDGLERWMLSQVKSFKGTYLCR